MEEAADHHHHPAVPPPAPLDAPSTSPASTSQAHEGEEGRNGQQEFEDNSQSQYTHQSSSAQSYRVNISISDMAPSEMRDDIWSCLVVLVTFWFFASMTLILGFCGSVNLQFGPNSSRLIKTNTFFVQSIKAQQEDDPKPGPVLYGFYEPPPLDVEINWTETHDTVVPVDFHKEWVYYLNKGSKVDILYSIKSPSSSPLSLVIAQGRESLVQWIDEPSYPNSTLSWNIILGNGEIEQEIPKSSNYYIAVGNLNSQDVEVELKFTMKDFIYNTTQAYYKCSLIHHSCSLKLMLLRTSAVVITTPGPKEGVLEDDNWYVKVSYGPRWITYFIGSGIMTILILLVLRFCNIFQDLRGGGNQADNPRSERVPLLSPKDDDISSWGSSYDSISHDDQDLDELLAINLLDGKSLAEGENLNRLCVICFDAPRDCFFLPCGHCAACFTCGTRIAENAGTCPICRRSMKKVRKIFTV